MRIVWETVTGSQESRPEVVDKTSSSKYVYLRRNFQKVTRTNENSSPVTLWQYEEAKVTQEEYAQYDTIVMEIVRAELDAIASDQETAYRAISSRADDLENATCEQSENVEARLTDIEIALCDLSEQLANVSSMNQ